MFLLQLLLWAQVACVAALLLSAVGGARVHSGVALAADHLVAVIFLCQHTERRLNNTTTQTKDQMESRLLLDVVVRESSAIFQLLTSEDQSLLVRRNAFFVLKCQVSTIRKLKSLTDFGP